MSISANRIGAKGYSLLRALKLLAVTVFVLGVLAQPVAMILVNLYAPSTVYDSLGGRVDPVSASLHWVTFLGPSTGVLLFTAYTVWKGFLSDSYTPWQELLVKLLLGVSVALLLAPVMFFAAIMLPYWLRS